MPWREIRWTEENEAHIAGHDVTPEEVEELVNSQPRYVKDGRDGTEWIYGRTNAGRYLFVVVTGSLDGLDYVVTARDMKPRERQELRDNTGQSPSH